MLKVMFSSDPVLPSSIAHERRIHIQCTECPCTQLVCSENARDDMCHVILRCIVYISYICNRGMYKVYIEYALLGRLLTTSPESNCRKKLKSGLLME